jgi:phage gp29-like protein
MGGQEDQPMNWKTLPSKLLSLLLPTQPQRSLDPRQLRPRQHDVTVDDALSAISAAESGDFGPIVTLGMQMVADDGHVRTEFAKRKLAVLGAQFQTHAWDKSNAEDVAAERAIRVWIEECDDWDDCLKSLLEGFFWPVAICEKVFVPSTRPDRRFDLVGLRRVDPALFNFTIGELRIDTIDPHGNRTGLHHFPDPAQYIIHRGDPLCLPDTRGGLLRPLLFWWFLKTKDWEWWGQFLERFGAPFLVGRYDAEDSASQFELEQAFSRASRLFGIVVSRDTEIEMVQAQTTQGAAAFEALHRTANEEISKVILGQFGTSQGTSGGGLNSNTASVLDGVRQDYQMFDAVQLSNTVRRQIFRQYLRVNGIPGRAPRAVWGDTSGDDNAALAQRLVSYRQAGLRLTDAAIEDVSRREAIQFQWDSPEAGLAMSAMRSFPAASPHKVAEIALNRLVVAAAPRVVRDISADIIDVPDDDPFLGALVGAALERR